MTRTALMKLAVTSVCLSGLALPARAQDAAIPDYFFKEWTISRDCSEQHAGPEGHVGTGLKFRISRESRSADGQTYALEAFDDIQRIWPGNWKQLRLEFRPGTRLERLPADFECVPGESASSPFLAMSGYSIGAEPWYEYEHWYGLVEIHGEAHHVLIFPRSVDGASSAVIVLQDADAGDSIKLDHNGTIHSDD